jgi:hypothetical protein
MKNTEVARFLATFSHGKTYVLILTKNWLDHILGDFLANSLQ